MNKLMIRVLVPVALVGFGVFCAGAMVMMKPTAQRSDPAVVAPLVEVVVVEHSDQPAQVRARGTVAPAQRVVVIPQVSGELKFVAPQLIPGGRFAKGEVLARIDSRDYQLGVRGEQSRVHQAELELKLEHGRQLIAKREWELLGGGRDESSAPLALRKPQLANVELAVDAAKSGLDRAELALERTRLRAPFNAMVVNESVDLGQVVGPQSQVATLVGTDQFWVNVAVSIDDMSLIVLPSEGQLGSLALVQQSIGNGKFIEREGNVLQLGGELDPQTRTASVLVAIDDPLAGDGLPLLPGAFVDVTLYGTGVSEGFVIPRRALHGGDQLFVVSKDNTLERRTVALVWGNEGLVSVGEGLNNGDQVIVSTVTAPIEGMLLRVLSDEDAAEATLDDSEGREL
ncbi:MAG: efflux RND transporter periplasmic adaptor subunit [Rhodobacterales bacterium]|nr:efflux RND transporter periplasmic adaptor subunit [Rhodobacterales bacterium]